LTNTKTKPEDFAWDQSLSGATVGQTFYIVLDNGDLALIQFVYTTISWAQWQVNCRYYDKNGTKGEVASTLSGSALTVSPDKQSVQSKDASILRGPDGSFNIHLHQGDIKLDVRIDGDVEKYAYKVNSGRKNFYESDPTAGHIQACFISKMTSSGQIAVKGKPYNAAGQAMLVCAVQAKPQTCGRWNFMTLQNEKDALMMYQFELPDLSPLGYQYSVKRENWASIVLDGKQIAVTVDNIAEHRDTELDSFCGFPVPKTIYYKWNGTTEDGKPVTAELSVPLTHLCDKIDLLAEMPWMVRKIVQTLITAPYVYQWLQHGKATITVDGQTRTIEGNGMFETCFMQNV
ncbi:hypothetical protein CXG81DRAFT_9996, partial [Caulochytrium protostelioides]